MATTRKSDGTATLTKEVRELRAAVDKAYGAFKISNQVRRTLALSFLKGVLSTMGAIATVVIVTPLIIMVLRSVAWPPLIADFVANVILQYEQSNRPSLRAVDGQ